MIPFIKKKKHEPGELIGKYKIVKCIGEGRFGICYLVNLNDEQYVLKELKPKAIKKSAGKVIFEEEILSTTDHPAIPKIFDTIKSDSIYAYILEYKRGRTVEDMIFGDNHIFTRDEIYKIGTKIIDIIKYLHERNIVHRDIRIPNVIIYGEEVYLIDFGLARLVNNERYIPSVDFSYLGHLLLHLYYSSFEKTNKKSKPWYEELDLTIYELTFLKKLLGLDDVYQSINDLKKDFIEMKMSQ